MKKISVSMCLALIVVSAGCKKDTSTSAPAASASTTQAVAAASGGGDAKACVDGAYKDPTGTYCVKLPNGVTPPKKTEKDETESKDEFDTSEDGSHTFRITYWTPTPSYSFTFEDIKKQKLEETERLKNVSHEDLPNGGLYSLRKENVKWPSIYTAAVVKRGALIITCEATYSERNPMTPPDACKTLRAM